jgi:DUF3072 family protein
MEPAMGIDKRNIDSDELSRESLGPIRPSGTGTHAAHRREAERAAEDPQRRGLDGRKAGTPGRAELISGEREGEGDPDGPMTDEQAEHLQILCEEAGEPFDRWLTHAAAERRIRTLQRRAGFKP